MEIAGDIEVRLLPVPSVVVQDLRIGEIEGEPTLTAERFSARAELMPLLSGRLAITEMSVDRPRLAVAVDDTGRVDWVATRGGAGTLDAERISVGRVTINNGELSFADARSGAAFTLSGITTSVFQAGSLRGPWQVRGTAVCQAAVLCGDGLPAEFTINTGRIDTDGSVRVTAEITTAAAGVAGTLSTEGTVAATDGGLAYAGSFRLDRAAPAASADGGEAPAFGPGWSLTGMFALDARQLALPGFTFTPADATQAVEGEGTLTFGDASRFTGRLETSRIDLDTLMGEGPAGAIRAGEAVARLLDGLRRVAPLPVSAEVEVLIPAVVLSRAVLEDLSFRLTAGPDGFGISGLDLVLPGEGRLEVDGRIATGAAPAFAGDLRLASDEPGGFAAWWRGDGAAAGRLAPFDIALRGDMAPAQIDVSRFDLAIGDSEASGALSWRSAQAGDGRRTLTLVADAGRLDVDQLAALGQLLLGEGFGGFEAMAEDYRVALTADALVAGEVTLAEVAIEASYADDALDVDRFTIGAIGGARFNVTEGRIEQLSGSPQGSLTATLEAEDLAGVSAVAARLAPDSGVTDWLRRTAPSLAPAALTLSVSAPTTPGPDYVAELTGTLGGTEVRAAISLVGEAEDWQDAQVDLSLEVDAAASETLLRQAGLPPAPGAAEGSATVDFTTRGVPAEGLETLLQITAFGGTRLDSAGTLAVGPEMEPSFDGSATLTAGDLTPLADVLGLDLPGGEPTSAVLTASVAADPAAMTVTILPSSLGTQSMEGELRLAEEGGSWRLQGTLALDEASLGWLAALPLGVPPPPPGDPEGPWSRAPFSGPALGELAADVTIVAGRLRVGEWLAIADAELSVSMRPDGSSLDLTSGSLGGGEVRGTIASRLADGEATLDGRFELTGVPADMLVWRRDGVPVAEGVLDLSAQVAGTGRSPAGLVGSLAGSGILSIDAGLTRFLNPEAFRLVLEQADEGRIFGEAELAEVFAGLLDDGDLAFDGADAAFDIEAGVATAGAVAIAGAGVAGVARARIDLNALTIDSGLNLALMPGPETVEGTNPEVSISFTGPLAAPVREVEVAAFNAYLAARRLSEAERLEAELLERERFTRLILRLEADRTAAGQAPQQ